MATRSAAFVVMPENPNFKLFLTRFAEEYETLKRLLGELQPSDRNSTVKRWATGGQVLLMFLLHINIVIVTSCT